MDEARGVVLVDPVRRRFEIRAVPGLVAHRPTDNARVILVAPHHPCHPLDKGSVPFGVLRRAIPDAVGLQIGLVQHKEAVFVAEIVPARIVGVVARAHRVDVERLHQLDVGQHRCDGDGVPGVGIVLVAIDALDADGHAVHTDAPVHNLHLAKTDARPLDLHHLARCVLQRQQQRVEVGVLVRPFGGIGDGDLMLDAGCWLLDVGCWRSPGTQRAGMLDARCS